MTLRPVLVAAVFALGAPAWAQSDKPATPPAKAPPSVIDKDKDAGYPSVVRGKKLYAKQDFRGRKAPEFAVEKWLSSEPSREGKTILIDFWATWCGPCVRLIPELNEWQTKFKDDLVVIGVSDEAESKVRPMMESKKVVYPMAIDTAAKMKNALGVEGIPHVLVISSDGIVRWQGFPGDKSDELTEAKLKQIIHADKKARADRQAKAPVKPAKPDSKPDSKPGSKPNPQPDPKRKG